MKVTFNEEETDRINDTGHHQSYVNESITVSCWEDLDIEKDWDGYLRELDTMGLAQYMETSQTAYDRTNK